MFRKYAISLSVTHLNENLDGHLKLILGSSSKGIRVNHSKTQNKDRYDLEVLGDPMEISEFLNGLSRLEEFGKINLIKIQRLRHEPGVSYIIIKEKTLTNKEIFISYSHKDHKWQELVLTHLSPLMDTGDTINIWSDKLIQPGSDWFDEIKKAIERSSIAILLLSPFF